MTVKEAGSKLTSRQRHGRAINAVAELLRRKLSVPNIYLEPPSNLISADVLAVDRGGAGDLHAVEIQVADLDPNQLKWVGKVGGTVRQIHRQLMSIPAHYRYLALPEQYFAIASEELSHLGLFSRDGLGRLGIIKLLDRGEAIPVAELAVVPERFRVDSPKLRTIETKLLDKSRPDIEVRL